MGLQFLLNDRVVTREAFAPDAMLLDEIRLAQRLTGTKEGCNEGDCGACTVLIGRIEDGTLVYRSVNACITFLGSVHGAHVVTVEHLSPKAGPLHPVQQAMVDHHGSQCGFCTPGIVMSLYALWMENRSPDVTAIERALQGNLCRCTGYEPIIKAALAMGETVHDRLSAEREKVRATLAGFANGGRTVLADGAFILPADEADLAAILADNPGATIVAGATDVGLWVTKGFRRVDPIVFIGAMTDLAGIEEAGDRLVIGAGVTYSRGIAALARLHPALEELVWRIGGQQVRNQGTIGGNIANGSPIGDMAPALIALGATIELAAADGRRTMPLEGFFIAYGKQARKAGEYVRAIHVPKPGPHERFAVYKVSKRRDEDITSLLGAFAVRLAGGVVAEARVCFGGMAGTPKRAAAFEAALVGKPLTEAVVLDALPALEKDYQPLSDWRASAEYRLLAAKNLARRFAMEQAGVARVRLGEVAHG